MILLTHIFIAVTSLVYTGFVFFKPSKSRIYSAYGLVVLTVASGTYLIITKPAHLTQTCITGLVYLAVVFVGIMEAQYKLAHTNS